MAHICFAANPFTCSRLKMANKEFSESSESKKSHVSQSLANGIEVKEFSRNSEKIFHLKSFESDILRDIDKVPQTCLVKLS